ASCRFRDRHSRPNSKLSCCVGGRLHDSAFLSSSSDYEALDVPQLGMTLPAHLDEKCIQVQVQRSCSHQASTLRLATDALLPPHSRSSRSLRRLPPSAD